MTDKTSARGWACSTCCVTAEGADIEDMVDNARDISRRTFLRYVDRAGLFEIEVGLGYATHPSRGLTMAGDWHVSYHKSRYQGRPCVYFRQSMIEHVFCPGREQ